MIPNDDQRNLDMFAHSRYIGGFYAYVPFFFPRCVSPLHQISTGPEPARGFCRGGRGVPIDCAEVVIFTLHTIYYLLSTIYYLLSELRTSHLKKKGSSMCDMAASWEGKDQTYSVIDDASAHQEASEHEDTLILPPLSGYALPVNRLGSRSLLYPTSNNGYALTAKQFAP